MNDKAVISLTTGLEDPEKVAVALLVAVGAAESGRPTLMFLTKEAVRLVVTGVAVGTACDGCPPIAGLLDRDTAAGGRCLVRPICFEARHLDQRTLIDAASIGGRSRATADPDVRHEHCEVRTIPGLFEEVMPDSVHPRRARRMGRQHHTANRRTSLVDPGAGRASASRSRSTH